jgi:hypothetical protein
MMDERVREILAGVRGTEPTPIEAGAAADHIAALGEAAVPALLEALAEEDEAVLAVAAGALRRLPSPALTHRLVGLLRSRHIGDLAKALILGILEDAGLDIHDPALVGPVVDLEGMLIPTGPAAPDGNGRRRSGGDGAAAASGSDPTEDAP